MAITFVDLTTPTFWLFAVAGILLLTPIVHAGTRGVLLAVLNITFLGTLLKVALLPLLGALVVLYALLCGMGNNRTRRWCVPLLLVGLGVLFVLHKEPFLADGIRLKRISPVLTALGYSYLFLRVIDVSRAVWEGRHGVPHICDLINYLLPFHMLAAGPIQGWDQYVAASRVPKPLTTQETLGHLQKIAGGLFKKFVLAFAITRVLLTHGQSVGFYHFVEMNLNYIWLYLDFSAYSDIALGIGGLLGVSTPVNFRQPYLARNITDFWERWHISLSHWIQRNLFFPTQLALVRKTEGKYLMLCASISFFVSFLLCGAWHAFTGPFLLWGALNAAGLVAVNLYRNWLRKKLGSKGMARYMASKPIQLAAIILTFEFEVLAISLQVT